MTAFFTSLSCVVAHSDELCRRLSVCGRLGVDVVSFRISVDANVVVVAFAFLAAKEEPC